MLEEYVNAINKPDCVPEVALIWEKVLTSTYEIGLQEALRVYHKAMKEVQLPMEYEDLLDAHSKSFSSATEVIKKHFCLYETLFEKCSREIKV